MSRLLLLLAVGALLLLTACGPTKDGPPLTPAQLPKEAPPPKTDKGDWESKWESTLVEAKKEGSVLLYTTWGAETGRLLSKAFRDKYGVDLQVLALSSGPEVIARVNAEQRAGLRIADVFGSGPITLLATMKPEGLLGFTEPLLILPEVKEARNWDGGRVPFLDKERKAMGMAAGVMSRIVHNTAMVKEGEITSYLDVLKPQYKGKIVMHDPTTNGAGVSILAHMATDLWDVERAKGFLRDLLSKQEAVILRDRRNLVEWVARGKYAISIGALPETVTEFMAIGSPIAPVVLKEGITLTTAGNGLGVPTVMAHPNATTLFINWLLSKEGQSVFIKGSGQRSARVDVPPEGVLPIFLPQLGEKTYPETEEAILFRGKMVDIAKEIVAAHSK